MLFMCKFLNQDEFAAKRETIRVLLHKSLAGDSEMLYIAFNEAVNNAFIHGYQDSSGHKPVDVAIYQENNELVIKVGHEGVGCYQNKKIKREGRKDSLVDIWEESGRGLFIINSCADYFEFNENGTELIMRKKISNT